MNEIMNIGGVDCYEKDGTAYLKLEAVARGLGFTQIAKSGNEVVRWERVRKYLEELGIPTCGDDDFIPENIFYRLAMKAKNETAERFQALVADEIIPSIRKHGAYMTPQKIEEALLNPDTIIKLATNLKAEREKRIYRQGSCIRKIRILRLRWIHGLELLIFWHGWNPMKTTAIIWEHRIRTPHLPHRVRIISLQRMEKLEGTAI